MSLEVSEPRHASHQERGRVRPRGSAILPALFTATAFVAASLLFVVQPMVARLVLPLFGGAATVWSTTSLFFQLVLLAGYWYAHMGTTRLGMRRQVALHAALLMLPLAFLPVAIPSLVSPEGSHGPLVELLKVLALTIGVPFAVISTSGPLLQRWYSWTTGPRADDPYFLYAASNLGSLFGLLAYPLLIEPRMTLQHQRWAWSAGFLVAGGLLLASGVAALRWRRESPASGSMDTGAEHPLVADASPTRRQQLTWLLLALLPSTLMLGVTAHISTDIAAIPLMWVVPLALYLLTFIVAFGRSGRAVSPLLTRAAVVLSAVTLLTTFLSAAMPVALQIALQLMTFTTVALAAHSRLAASRPSAEHLTHFYLVVAIGGAAGGLLNGFVAPLLFDRVWEYQLALLGGILVGLGTSALQPTWFARRYGERPAAVLRTLVYALFGGFGLLVAVALPRGLAWIAVAILLLGVGAWFGSRRSVALASATAVVVAAFTVVTGSSDLERARTFYGAYRVKYEDGAHVLVHGTTVHGTQRTQEAAEPTTYYSRTGPLGAVFAGLQPRRVGVIGLGAGTIAAYGQTNQTMTFYEIDPGIRRIAQDDRLFTYLRDSPATIHTVVGDGRLEISKAPKEALDLIVLDAFSSDSIPVHLLTEEAFATYAEKLSPNGVLAIHISNRVFDLEPVVASAAAKLGWDAAIGSGGADEHGGNKAVWIVMSPEQSRLSEIATTSMWRPITTEQVRWTDDYSSVLTVLNGWS